MSRVTCHLSLTITATATDPPLLTPPLSTVGWSTVGWLRKPKKSWKKQKNINNQRKERKKIKEKIIVSLQGKISDTPSDQNFFWPPEEGVLDFTDWQTNKRTDKADSGPNRTRGWNYCVNLYIPLWGDRAMKFTKLGYFGPILGR